VVLKRAGGRHHPGQVLRRAQIASDGAIVVRPDRFIAWRFPAAASDPGRTHRRAQPDPWAQTVCSAKVGRFLTGSDAGQR